MYSLGPGRVIMRTPMRRWRVTALGVQVERRERERGAREGGRGVRQPQTPNPPRARFFLPLTQKNAPPQRVVPPLLPGPRPDVAHQHAQGDRPVQEGGGQHKGGQVQEAGEQGDGGQGGRARREWCGDERAGLGRGRGVMAGVTVLGGGRARAVVGRRHGLPLIVIKCAGTHAQCLSPVAGCGSKREAD